MDLLLKSSLKTRPAEPLEPSRPSSSTEDGAQLLIKQVWFVLSSICFVNNHVGVGEAEVSSLNDLLRMMNPLSSNDLLNRKVPRRRRWVERTLSLSS